MSHTTIIVPAKDEEIGLKFLLANYKESRFFDNPDISFIFVIDGRTSDLSKNVASKFSDRVIDQKETHGKGSAIRQAVDIWKENKTRFVIFLDADGSYSFNEVEKIISALEDGSDVVSGSRFLSGNWKPKGMSMMHIFGNRMLSIISSIKNRRKISDLCTGLWGFNSKAMDVIDLQSEGFDLEAEIAGKSRKHGLSHQEIPVIWSDRKGGSSKLRSFRDGFIILLRIIKT